MVRFWRACKANWRLMPAALLTVVAIRIALWVLPFRHVHGWVHRRRCAAGSGDIRRRMRIARAVARMSRLVPAASCLTQALAAQWLLRLRGERAQLCLGMTRSKSGHMEAHAWLEHDGGVLIGNLPHLGSYHRFNVLSAAS